MKKFLESTIIVSLGIVAVMAFVRFYHEGLETQKTQLSAKQKRESILSLYQEDYVDIDYVMETINYTKTKANDSTTVLTYSNDENNLTVTINPDTNKITKDVFTYDITNPLVQKYNRYYINKTDIEKVINKEIDLTDNTLVISDMTQKPNTWITTSQGVIAHATGSYHTATDLEVYSNSREAIIENYNMGTRVFEVDLSLTSDNDLAAVHVWESAGYKTPPTAAEWKEHGLKREVAQKSTPLLIDDILDLMLINPDMYIVTDTKSFVLTDDETRQQFETLTSKAQAKDPELLKQIIPYIYSASMYDIVTSIYNYPSMIYANYGDTDEPIDDIVNFIKDKQNIQCAIFPYTFITEDVMNKVHSANKTVFAHTVNDFGTTYKLKQMGVEGICTDFFTPASYKDTIYK